MRGGRVLREKHLFAITDEIATFDPEPLKSRIKVPETAAMRLPIAIGRRCIV